MKYILNRYYILRHDEERTFILGGRNGVAAKDDKVDLNWISTIHPAYAMMLSFFSRPIELEVAVNEISDFFSFPKTQIKKFLSKIITAEECWHTTMGGVESGFPKGLIIETREENECPDMYKYYKPGDFKFSKLDFNTRRMLSAPLSIVWMPNNNCYTACEYCYADRKHHHCMFSLNKIRSFIKDARESGVVEILLTGGDFFENIHWKEILDTLKEEGYNIDMISTKKPLTETELKIFREYGIRLQVSLDTLSEQIAKQLLHVGNGYVDKMMRMIHFADQLHIDFQIATVLTNLNDSLENLETLYNCLSNFINIRHWEIRVAFRSLYSKTDFNKIKSSRSQIKRIGEWIEEKEINTSLRILWSPDEDSNYKKAIGGSKYFPGPVCSANMTNMIVLPDGSVTICEQLYWNPEFIIGNVFSERIGDIWKSENAIDLWKKSQEFISKKSPCSKCKDFQECFDNGNRCIANIIKAYGVEHSDYPDPRCYLAPEFKNVITHE